jgi:hypothetical protein
MDVEVGWDFAVERLQERLNSIARWRECSRPMTVPVAMSSAA